MRRKEVASCAAVLVGLAAGTLAVTQAAAANATAPTSAVSAPAPDWETQDMTAAYLRDFPGLTVAQAVEAIRGQKQRILLLERLQAADPNGFGGSWYDPRTNTQHVNTVGLLAADRARRLAAELGLTTVLHHVSHSLRELAAIAAEINDGRHPVLGQAGVNRATPDAVNNQVTVELPAKQLAMFRASQALQPPIVVQQGQSTYIDIPELCTDRLHCGSPLRSGIVLWGQGVGNVCSLGFTARATDGSRWAVTAGHCGALTGDGVTWGHGEQPIGPIRYGRDSGNVDAARIHVRGTYWSTGGYFFNASSPNTPLPVDYAIAYRGTIQVGDGVCLSAWHSVIGNACGTIVDAYGYRGMPQASFDACPGDSGGGWYHIAGGGERWAYGIHRGQPPSTTRTCHDHAENDSIFTAIPDLNAWWDDTTAATLRIEYR